MRPAGKTISKNNKDSWLCRQLTAAVKTVTDYIMRFVPMFYGTMTQKPYKLIERLVLMLSNEGDTILDNFAGSGTLGEVCVNTNRKCVLIEKEKEYFDLIKTRLDKYKFFV